MVSTMLRPPHTFVFATFAPAFALESAMIAVVFSASFPAALVTSTFPTLVATAVEIVILGESDTRR